VCISSDSLTEDPLSLANTWAYEMINVDKVWKEYTGKGVRIRINDDGVDINNKDFEGRFDQASSCENYLPLPGETNGHGTKVAGIIAGNADNAHCAAGIAYESTFSSCNVYGGNVSYQSLDDNLELFDISSNSIGLPACDAGDDIEVTQLDACPFTVPANSIYNPCDESKCDYATNLSGVCTTEIYRYCKANFRYDDISCVDFLDIMLSGKTCDYDKLPLSAVQALANGVKYGRDGKGIVYVFASGNDFFEGDDVNMSRWTNSRYTITVGAVGKDGLHTDYSTPGAALHVTGPAGDSNDASHILTTDLDGTCGDSGSGTSFSAPVVSGVIALMLEANAALTWRDVQGILAVTSAVPDDSSDKTKTTNAAGVTHSNFYGFGIINAKAAVDTALTWNNWSPEYQAIGESAEENQPIDNNGETYVSELEISSEYKGFAAESTVVLLNLQHYNRGDLQLTLVSPSGTKSILHPGRRPENTQLEGNERWKLMTVRNWGEDPSGTWKLEITDLTTDNTVATGANELRQWQLVVYGRTEDGDPPVLTKPSNPPSLAPTISQVPSDVGGNPEEVSEAPTTEETTDENAGTDGPTDGTNSPVDAPTTDAPIDRTNSPVDAPTTDAPTDGTNSPVDAPTTDAPTDRTNSPVDAPTTDAPTMDAPTTDAPTIAGAPTDGTEEPATLAPVAPTLRPALRPTRLPTLRIVRPTTIVAVPTQERSSGQGPGLPASATVSTSRPSPSGLFGALGVSVQRPTSIIGGNVQLSTTQLFTHLERPTSNFVTLETEGEEEEQFVAIELVEDLSLVLEGVSEIPEASWSSIQLALEQHTTSVIATVMPALHFKTQIRLFSIAPTERPPTRERWSLRPERDATSVIIFYDELVQFDHLPGTENLMAATLAGLPFKDSHDREAFVAKIHRDFDGVDPMLESLVRVSDLALPPTSPPVSMPMEAAVPTPASNTDNNVVGISGYENDNEVPIEIPINDPISEDEDASSNSRTPTIIASYAAVVGLWCAIMFIVLGRRN